MTEPASFDEQVTPAIVLAGKKWPVPPLAPRQLRHIWKQLCDLTKAIDEKVKERREANEGNESDVAAGAFGEMVISLTNEQFDAMTDCVFYGLTRAHPKLTRDEFEDMPITPAEIAGAFLIVRAQSGLFRADAAGEGGAPGEAQGA